MRVNEKAIASARQDKQTTVTSSLLEAGYEQAERDTQVVRDAQTYLTAQTEGWFPLALNMFWKLEAGMEVETDQESTLWYPWVNQALGGIGKHIEAPVRKRIALEMCQAALKDLTEGTLSEDLAAVIAADKGEGKPDPAPWSYEKNEIILSLIGNKEFDTELLHALEDVRVKVKAEDEDGDKEKGDVLLKVRSYQLSAPLSEVQQAQGLEREVILVLEVAKDHEKKFFTAAKKKLKGFKVEQLEEFRSPMTQGRLIAMAGFFKIQGEVDQEMLNSYLETALWSEMDNSNEQGGDPLDSKYDVENIDPETLKQAEQDCLEFVEKAGALLEGLDMSQVGHDFWLTRNGHGAGFWDGDYEKEIGQKLTDISKQFKNVDLVIGDDGMIHSSVWAETQDLEEALSAEPVAANSDEELLQDIISFVVNNKNDDFSGADVSGKSDEEIDAEIRESFQSPDHRIGSFTLEGIEFKFAEDEKLATFEAEDRAEELLGEGILSPKGSPWLKDYLHVSDTDKRIFAGEEADHYLEDMSDEDKVKEAELQDEYEAEGADQAAIVQKAHDLLHDRKYEEVEAAMEDPFKYFVTDHGLYSEEDFMAAVMKGGFLVGIDTKEAAKYIVRMDGWVHELNRWDGETSFETAKGLVFWRDN